MGWRAAFIVVIAALVPAPAAYGAVFTVTGAGEGGTCSGTSCPSLRAAITAAEGTRAEADTINVPEGVIGINNDLVVQSEMTINGADARKTIIDGGAKYRLRTTASGILTLNRFTIRNGAAGGGDITDGGGIYNAGRLNLQDVRVTGSTAVRGGGIANNLGIVVADNLLVDNNVATGAGGGGGILNVAGQELPELRGWLIVTDTTIFKNTATGTGGIGEQPPCLRHSAGVQEGAEVVVAEFMVDEAADGTFRRTHLPHEAGEIEFGIERAVEGDLALGEIEALAHRPRRGQQLFRAQGQVHGG